MAKEVEDKALSAKVVLIVIILGLTTAWFRSHVGGEVMGFWEGRRIEYFAYAWYVSAADSLLIAMLCGLINRFKKVFSTKEIAMLAVLFGFQGLLFRSANISQTPYSYSAVFFASPAEQERFLGLFNGNPLFPKIEDQELWQSIIYGGWAQGVQQVAPAFDWTLWASIIGWISLWKIGLTLAGFSLALLLRRTYVEVESLPFPYGELHLQIIDQAEALYHGKKESKLNKWFFIGLLVSFSWYLLSMIQDPYWLFTGEILYPIGFATGYPQFLPGELMLNRDLTPLGLLPWVPLWIGFELHYIGWSIVVPLEITLSVIVGFLIFYVIYPIVASGAGYFPAWDIGHSSDIYYNILCYPENGALIALAWGASFALVAVPLWRNRYIFGRILKSVTGATVARDVDPNLPIPYKYAWALLIVSFVVLIGVGIWAWLPPGAWILGVIGTAILGVAAARAFAAGGGWIGTPLFEDSWERGIGRAWFGLLFGYLVAPLGATAGAMLFYDQAYRLGGRNLWYMMYGICFGLLAFYIARRMEISSRNMLKGMLVVGITSLVSMVVWHCLAMVGIAWPETSITGAKVPDPTREFLAIANWIDTGSNHPMAQWHLYPEKTWPYLIVGFIAFAALFWMRGKFARFPISPVGLFLGLNFGPYWWTAAIVGFIIKSLFVRVLGVQRYNQIARPLAIGLVLGFCLVWVVHDHTTMLYATSSMTGLWFP